MKWEQNYVAQAAQQKRIIPGFNIFGYEDAQAVIRAAERAVCPVLLMINRDARTAMAVEHWSALLNALAESSSVPVGIHWITVPKQIPSSVRSTAALPRLCLMVRTYR